MYFLSRTNNLSALSDLNFSFCTTACLLELRISGGTPAQICIFDFGNMALDLFWMSLDESFLDKFDDCMT